MRRDAVAAMGLETLAGVKTPNLECAPSGQRLAFAAWLAVCGSAVPRPLQTNPISMNLIVNAVTVTATAAC